MTIETLRVSDLGVPERARWDSLRRANPALGSPYFDLRYIDVAGAVAPGARIAILRRDGQTVGFLPYQRRGGLLQPLGAPMSDFHGLIAEVGAGLDLSALLREIGAERARVRGLIGEGQGDGAGTGLSLRHAMASDLSAGFEAYAAGRNASFLKDKRRRRRALERDHGPVIFSFERPDPERLNRIIEDKRRQLHRTHQYDIFACGWTGALLHRLAESTDPDFGLRLATLTAGDVVVAAELGLTSGDRHHLWFPTYNTSYARYSPGSLMTLDTLRVAAEQGIKRVDFGPSEEAYKRDFADPVEPVFEGLIHARPDQVRGLDRLPGLNRLSRRFDRIVACEPGLMGQVRGTSAFVTAMGRRHPRLGAGLGLTLGLGLSLSALAD